MVHRFVNVFLLELVIAHGIMAVHFSAVPDVAEDFGWQSLALYVRHYLCPNLALSAVEDTLHNCFACGSASVPTFCCIAHAPRAVHVLEFSADERLVHFDTAPALGAH